VADDVRVTYYMPPEDWPRFLECLNGSACAAMDSGTETSTFSWKDITRSVEWTHYKLWLSKWDVDGYREVSLINEHVVTARLLIYLDPDATREITNITIIRQMKGYPSGWPGPCPSCDRIRGSVRSIIAGQCSPKLPHYSDGSKERPYRATDPSKPIYAPPYDPDAPERLPPWPSDPRCMLVDTVDGWVLRRRVE